MMKDAKAEKLATDQRERSMTVARKRLRRQTETTKQLMWKAVCCFGCGRGRR